MGNPEPWKIDGDDPMDEDSLLQDIDKQVVSVLPVNDDCEKSGGKSGACKNCTCGRADMDEEQLENTKSSCGNCYLGWTETAWWKPMEALLWSRRTFARLKPPRRGWFWGMGNVSRWDLIWDATPSIILIFLYHTGYFLYSRFWGSARSRALHDYGDKHF